MTTSKEDDANIRKELEPFVSTVSETPGQAPIRILPRNKALLTAGFKALGKAIAANGGMKSMTKLMNARLPYRNEEITEGFGIQKMQSPKMSEETKQRMSKARKRVVQAGYTYKHSPESRAKIAASRRGKHCSEATKQKLREFQNSIKQKQQAHRAKQLADIATKASTDKSSDMQNTGDRASDMPAAGKRRVQAVAGTVNMQQVVRELSDLKRDLRDWRSRTNKKYGRSLTEEETLHISPDVYRKMRRHDELQDIMHGIDSG